VIRFLRQQSLRFQTIAVAGTSVLIVPAALLPLLWAGGFSAPLPAEAVAGVVCSGAALAITVLVGSLRRVLTPLARLPEQAQAVAAGLAPAEGFPSEQPSDVSGVLRTVADLRTRMADALLAQDTSQKILAQRTATVDRLLEFSRSVHSSGEPGRIYHAMIEALRRELPVESIGVLTYDAAAEKPAQVAFSWPPGLQPREASDCDAINCPCLKQNQPRHFRAGAGVLRCPTDAALGVDESHATYCIPLPLGQEQAVLVHMTLQPGLEWTENFRQIAHAYAETAQSALHSLHLLATARRASMTDPLTGLYNRRSMERMLQRELALADRHGHRLALVMIDMDNFKQINDTHGHAAGDHVLRSLAECIRATLRKTDLAFRYGGDEFVLALPQTTISQAAAVLAKLRRAFHSLDFTSAIARMGLQPTLSVGMVERSPEAGLTSLPDLLQAADQALYQAKKESRNCVRLYQPTRAA
jgi:diguanylate cyclase (GGDEF)-like protein